MLKSGDVVLARVQYVDTLEIKTRPALVLFAEFGNVVLAGITSNKEMKGVPLLKSDGAVKDSVIKLNYIFTISEQMIVKKLFRLSRKKNQEVFEGLREKLSALEA
jgi:mRNA interferase MazF